MQIFCESLCTGNSRFFYLIFGKNFKILCYIEIKYEDQSTGNNKIAKLIIVLVYFSYPKKPNLFDNSIYIEVFVY